MHDPTSPRTRRDGGWSGRSRAGAAAAVAAALVLLPVAAAADDHVDAVRWEVGIPTEIPLDAVIGVPADVPLTIVNDTGQDLRDAVVTVQVDRLDLDPDLEEGEVSGTVGAIGGPFDGARADLRFTAEGTATLGEQPAMVATLPRDGFDLAAGEDAAFALRLVLDRAVEGRIYGISFVVEAADTVGEPLFMTFDVVEEPAVPVGPVEAGFGGIASNGTLPAALGLLGVLLLGIGVVVSRRPGIGR